MRVGFKVHAINFGDRHDAPRGKYLWWVSKETFDRAVREGVAKGYLPASARKSIDEAEMYKGISKSAGTLGLLDGLYRVAQDYAASPQHAAETQYAKDLVDLGHIWRRWHRDNT